MANPYQEAKAAGYSDEEIARHLAGPKYGEARAAGYSDLEIIRHQFPVTAAEAGNLMQPMADIGKGPLDITSPASPAGAAARWLAVHTPEAVKRPAAAAANWLSSRLSAGTAAALEPFAPAFQSLDQALKEKWAEGHGLPPPEPLPKIERMRSIPATVGKIAQGFVLGKSPLPGVDPRLATDELLRRTAGEYHALTPEQADAIDRAAWGLPLGQVARAATGTEGAAFLLQGPGAEAMSAPLQFLGPIAYAVTGKIHPIGVAREVGNIKTAAIRERLAQEAEQGLELDKLRAGTDVAAKQAGVPWEVMDAQIREARMLRPRDGGAALDALSPEARAVAEGYDAFDAAQVAQHVEAGLRPGVRGSHIERERQVAMTGTPERAAVAAKRLKRYLAASGIKVPAGEARQPFLEALPQQLAGHAAAVPTEEASNLIARSQGKLPRGAFGAGGSFGVQQVAPAGRRVRNYALTAGEKEARFAERFPEAGTPLYRSGLESTAIRAATRARSRASAMFFNDLAKTFGKPIERDALTGAEIIPQGHARLSELGIAKSGFDKATRARIEATAVPEDVLRRASQVVQTLRDPNLGSYRNWWTKSVAAWKGLVLARPGYPLRNTYDNAFVAWGVGAKSEYAPIAAKAVAVSLGNARYADELVPGLNITYREFVAQARRDGPLTGGFVSSELPKPGRVHPIAAAAPTLTKGAVKVANVGKTAYGGFRNANAASENFFRTLVYTTKRVGEGWSRKEAGRLVDDMLGKYNPAFLGKTEQAISRYGFPWYNWLKQITKRSARLVGEYPGSVARAAAIPTELNRMQGFTPAQVEALGPGVRAGGAIVRPVQGQEGNVEIFPTTFYGPTDINRIFGTGEWGPPGILINAARQAYPPVLALLGAFGVNPPRGKQFTGEGVETVSTVRLLPDWAKKRLGIKQVGERWFAPDRVDYFARMNPALFVSAISDASSDDQQTQKNFRAFVTGLSSYVRNQQDQDFLNQSVQFGAMRDQVETARRTMRNEQRSLESQSQGR